MSHFARANSKILPFYPIWQKKYALQIIRKDELFHGLLYVIIGLTKKLSSGKLFKSSKLSSAEQWFEKNVLKVKLHWWVKKQNSSDFELFKTCLILFGTQYDPKRYEKSCLDAKFCWYSCLCLDCWSIFLRFLNGTLELW